MQKKFRFVFLLRWCGSAAKPNWCIDARVEAGAAPQLSDFS